MCIKLCVSSFAAALSVAVFLLMPNGATAKPPSLNWGGSGAFKAKPAPFLKPHAQAHRGYFKRPWFSGLYAGFASYYDATSYTQVVGDAPSSERLDPYLPPPYNLNCHRSRQAVTVRSEYGGERTITVTRC